MVETILEAEEPVTVLSIGPCSSVRMALSMAPEIAAKARFVGMHGAVRRGYRDSPTPVPEYNVFIDVPAFRAALAADWPKTLTPLDTCGTVILDGDDYARVRDSDDPLARIVIDNYRVWAAAAGRPDMAERRSSTLFDTVAVYLAFAEDLLQMETIRLAVKDDGLTHEAAQGAEVRAAMAWRDYAAFKRLLIERLTTSGQPSNHEETSP
jgi:inosine-uridine nucleoside N-ribohydrolase